MRPIHLRLSALCLPLFFSEAKKFVPFVAKARMQLHRENAIAFLAPCGRGQIARSAIR
jgi:hypothetical protein